MILEIRVGGNLAALYLSKRSSAPFVEFDRKSYGGLSSAVDYGFLFDFSMFPARVPSATWSTTELTGTIPPAHHTLLTHAENVRPTI